MHRNVFPSTRQRNNYPISASIAHLHFKYLHKFRVELTTWKRCTRNVSDFSFVSRRYSPLIVWLHLDNFGHFNRYTRTNNYNQVFLLNSSLRYYFGYQQNRCRTLLQKFLDNFRARLRLRWIWDDEIRRKLKNKSLKESSYRRYKSF